MASSTPADLPFLDICRKLFVVATEKTDHAQMSEWNTIAEGICEFVQTLLCFH